MKNLIIPIDHFVMLAELDDIWGTERSVYESVG